MSKKQIEKTPKKADKAELSPEEMDQVQGASSPSLLSIKIFDGSGNVAEQSDEPGSETSRR